MNKIKEISDIVPLLEDDACKVSVETNVYPSIYIAIAIYEFKKYGEYFLIKCKNPYNSFLKENTYFSYMDAMRKFSLITAIYSKTLLSERNILNKIYNDQDIIDTILNISLEYNLQEINKKFIYIIFDNKNIIDIPKEKNIDIYFVKRFSNSTTLLKTMDINEAKRICIKNPGTIVVDSKGNTVYGKKDTERKLIKSVRSLNTTDNIYIGSKINLLKANLYNSFESNIPTRSISGTYKISSNIKNNRYKISSVFDDNLVIGYVKLDDIEKIN